MSHSPKQAWWRRWFGSRSERAAARHLKSIGYRILVRNYTSHFGELDLIAADGKTIVFVEVRSTESKDVSRPAESVDLAKQRRLTRLALAFLQKKRLIGYSARFDVVTISWPANQKKPTIVHHKNAFEATGRYQIDS